MLRYLRLVVSGLLLSSLAVAAVAETGPRAAATAADPAAAAAGTTLRTITAEDYSCGAGAGVAFDGASLLLSCEDSRVITAVSPADGSLVSTYSISGVDSIGALAWDRTRGQLWACGEQILVPAPPPPTINLVPGVPQAVYRIDLATRTATATLTDVPGCRNGLAYDGIDDTLWLSPDTSTPTLYHFTLAGQQLGTLQPDLGESEPEVPCASSGVAVGGRDLFLSNNGCSQVFRAPRADLTNVSQVGRYSTRLEDLECDDLTFSGKGQAAIWSHVPASAELTALELAPGDCGYGGVRPGHLGGPVVLTGIDAEDCGTGDPSPFDHGPISSYVTLVRKILAATSNGGSGILVIGANGEEPVDLRENSPNAFWRAIDKGINDPVPTNDHVTFQPPDQDRSLRGFKMVAVVGSAPETCLGLTDDQNQRLASRQSEFAEFVNNGGGLLGNSQSDFTNQYAYVGGLAKIQSVTDNQQEGCRREPRTHGYCDIVPTDDGRAVGITEALNVCCWHNVFTAFPPFLRVLARRDIGQGTAPTGPVAAIGSQHAFIPVSIQLDPATAANPARTNHTVTATIQNGRQDPQAGLQVSFSILEGSSSNPSPNAGQRSDPGECTANLDCTTDAAGRVSWTYRSNGEIGRDEIQACFTNPTTEELACTTATKDWTSGDPAAVLSPEKLDFGDQPVGHTSGPLPLQISNGGTGRLELGALTASGPAAAELTIEPCTEKVLFGGDPPCTAHVRITPATAGKRQATITLTSSALTSSAEPKSVDVVANGAVSDLRATPSPLDVGKQPVGTVGTGRHLTLTNEGTVPLRLTSIGIDGPDALVFGLAAVGSSCPVGSGELAAGASCAVGVNFNPDRIGVHLARLRVEAAPVLRPNPGDVPPPVIPPVSVDVTLVGTSAAATLSAQPSPLRLPPGVLGQDSPAATVTVRNPGPGPARLGTVSLTGPDAARFRLDAFGCAGRTLPARATCPIAVRQHPERFGPITASLVLTSRDIAAPLVVAVSGASAPVSLSAQPNPLRFPTGLLGQDSRPATVTVRNLGPLPARLGTVSLTGPDAGQFRLDASGCAGRTLRAGETCPIAVRQHPDRVGPVTASLTLTSIDTAAPLVVRVDGAGAEPTLQVDPPIGRPKSVVHITGTGFPPGDTTLSWDPGLGEEHANVGTDGRIDEYLLVYPHDQLGVRQAVATAPGGIIVRAPFLVVPPVAVPPLWTDD